MGAVTGACDDEAPGWFGKLSTLGDFAQRRLSPDMVRICDGWLSDCMRSAPALVGAGWTDIYLTAPVLRFAWAPGIVDGAWWFGVLMPSCDNVGRYFPLLVAQRRAKLPRSALALDDLDAWFDALSVTATRTLQADASVDAFEMALQAMRPWQARTDVRGTALGDVACAAVVERSADCAWWWSGSHDAAAALVHRTRGLPDPATFAMLLAAR